MFVSINDLVEFTTTTARFGRGGSVEVENGGEWTELTTTEARGLLTVEPHNYELAEALRQAELVAFIVEEGRF